MRAGDDDARASRELGRAGFVSDGRQRAAARAWIERLGVRCRDVDQPVRDLSGGNQQKVALGRLLHHDVDVLLLDKTGTITLGNRQATAFLPAVGVDPQALADAAQLSSLADETPEGRSIVVLAKENYGIRERDIAALKVAMVGLPADTGDKKPSELSGGMRKRASLARALALDPELMFLDEPTAGLDPIGAAHYDELVKGLNKSLGVTILMVTHDLDSLYAACDRIAVLLDKRVVAGTIDELLAYDHPWVQEYFRGPRGRAAARQESNASNG